MSVVVAHKWAGDPMDASVAADGTVDWSRARAGLSEYDQVAIEVARTVADAVGAPCVGICVGGPDAATPGARKAALSRGLDSGLVVADAATRGWNATDVGAALAELARRAGARIVLAGDASLDESARMVPALVAGHLAWPCFQDVVAVHADDDAWLLEQRVARGVRTVRVDGPVVVAVAPDAAKPSVPGMKDVLAAARKPVDVVPLAELGVTPVPVEVVGRAQPQPVPRRHVALSGPDAIGRLAEILMGNVDAEGGVGR